MDLDIYWMNRVPQFFPNNIRRPSTAYAALWRGSIFNLLIPSFFLPSIYKKWKEISCVRTRTFSVIYAFIQSSYRAGDILLLCMKTSSGFNFHKIINYSNLILPQINDFFIDFLLKLGAMANPLGSSFFFAFSLDSISVSYSCVRR